VADHPGAPTDVALGDRPRRGGLERGARVLGPDVHAVDVVERAVPGLPNDGQAPEVLAARSALDLGSDQGVVDDADGVRVREPDRRGEHPRLADPLEPGQLAVPVQPVRPGEDRLLPRVALVREDDGDSRSHRLALDEGRVTDADARDVGDGVLLAGRKSPDLDPEVSRARPGHGSSLDSAAWKCCSV
jgi:hypothetical protein